MTDLSSKRCIPCEGGIPALTEKEPKKLQTQIKGWHLLENQKLRKEIHFVNFRHTMDFVNRVAELAENEGHHPDLHISYGTLIIEIWTYAIKGLSENDFILAAKIDKLTILP